MYTTSLEGVRLDVGLIMKPGQEEVCVDSEGLWMSLGRAGRRRVAPRKSSFKNVRLDENGENRWIVIEGVKSLQ